MEAAGASVYASPEYARIGGNVVNNATAITAAKVPNSSRAHRKVSIPNQEKGQYPNSRQGQITEIMGIAIKDAIAHVVVVVTMGIIRGKFWIAFSEEVQW